MRCAGWDGTSTRPTRRTAAIFFRSAPSVIRASRARRCGSIRAVEELRDLPVEPRASRRQRGCDGAARQGRDGCRRGAAVAGGRCAHGRVDGASTAGSGAFGRRPPSATPPPGENRARHEPTLAGIDVLVAENFARLRGQARRPAHESDRPLARRREHDRSALPPRRA